MVFSIRTIRVAPHIGGTSRIGNLALAHLIRVTLMSTQFSDVRSFASWLFAPNASKGTRLSIATYCAGDFFRFRFNNSRLLTRFNTPSKRLGCAGGFRFLVRTNVRRARSLVLG
jgi:hypothetical protein